MKALHAKEVEEKYFRHRGFGKTTESFISQAEYLSMNGHDRDEVYEYSLKKIQYYFGIIEKHNNKKMHDDAIKMFNTMASIQGGDAKAFQKFLDSFNIN